LPSIEEMEKALQQFARHHEEFCQKYA